MLQSKRERLNAMKDLIMNNIITGQEMLLNMLNSKGYSVTQATLSRDMKELKIAKIPDANVGYRYVIPNFSFSVEEMPSHGLETMSTGIRSIEFSGNLAVVKTQPGYANVAASLIDANHIHDIIGTLAGDDTVLLVLNENSSHQNVIKILSEIIPDIQNRIL